MDAAVEMIFRSRDGEYPVLRGNIVLFLVKMRDGQTETSKRKVVRAC